MCCMPIDVITKAYLEYDATSPLYAFYCLTIERAMVNSNRCSRVPLKIITKCNGCCVSILFITRTIVCSMYDNVLYLLISIHCAMLCAYVCLCVFGDICCAMSHYFFCMQMVYRNRIDIFFSKALFDAESSCYGHCVCGIGTMNYRWPAIVIFWLVMSDFISCVNTTYCMLFVNDDHDLERIIGIRSLQC